VILILKKGRLVIRARRLDEEMKKDSKSAKSTPTGVGVISASGGGLGSNIKLEADQDPTSSSGCATPTHPSGVGDSCENGQTNSGPAKENFTDDPVTLNGGGDGGNAGDRHKSPDGGGPGNATPGSHCDGPGGGPQNQDDPNGSNPQQLNSLDPSDADFLDAFDTKDGGKLKLMSASSRNRFCIKMAILNYE